MKKNASSPFFILGFGVLAFLLLTVVITAVIFLLGGSVTPIVPIVSLAASSYLTYFLAKRNKSWKPIVQALLIFVFAIVSVAFATITTDVSYDGNSYHKSAIGQLKNGWNPIYEDVNTFNASDDNTFIQVGWTGEDRGYDTPWINHYPKAVWIFAANVYSLTGNIESGKAATALLIIALFLFAFGYLRQKLARNKSIIIALLLAFNPVIVLQLYSYYNDGIVGNLLLILLIALTLLIDTTAKVPSRRLMIYGTVIATIALVVNIKFTGLAYAGIIALVYWLWFAVKKQWRVLGELTIAGIIALVVGLGLIGSSSYIKNTLTSGHPLYPLAGEDSIDIMTRNQPESYANKSGIHKFLEANFSETTNISYDYSLEHGDSKLKVPFTINFEELKQLSYQSSDIRQAGYGVWFGGILIVSFIAAVYLVVRFARRNTKILPLVLLPLATLGITIIAFDNSWWSRYLPHLYLVPILITVLLFATKHKVLPYIFIGLLVVNIAITAVMGVYGQQKQVTNTNDMFRSTIDCTKDEPLVYSSNKLDGTLYNVWDYCPKVRAVTPQEFESKSDDTWTRIRGDLLVLQ